MAMGLAALALGASSLVPGFLLHNDSVAVPNQDLLPWMWGAGTAPPRSVPQDAVVAVLDNLVPGWILQRLMVVGALLLLGLGVAHLMRDRTRLERACAVVVAVWSTFVFERMAMGHWGLLLGVAVLPWVISATADARDRVPGAAAKAVAWAALGSLVPTAGALQLAGVAAVLGWPGPRDLRRSAGVLCGVLALQTVWIVPGLIHPGSATEQAADVFALRSEGWAGPVLTALATGGIWNSAAMPPSRAGVMALIAGAVLVGAALVGASRVRRMRPTVVGPLAVLAVAGLAWAVLTALPAAASLVAAVEVLPGGGLLRDAQKWLAPWLILLALAAGSGFARVADAFRGSDARGPAAALVLLLPVLMLPDLAFGMWGRLAPVRYPGEWEVVRSHLAGSDHPGDVVSWPWSTFRAYDWNGGRTSLDPAPRYLPRTVVTDSRLLVAREGELVVVPSDDPRSSQVGQALLAPDAAERLAGLGIGWILLQRGQPATPGYPVALPAPLESASVQTVRAGSLELRRLAGPDVGESTNPWQVAAWLAWGFALLASMAVGVRDSRLVRDRAQRIGPGSFPEADRS